MFYTVVQNDQSPRADQAEQWKDQFLSSWKTMSRAHSDLLLVLIKVIITIAVVQRLCRHIQISPS